MRSVIAEKVCKADAQSPKRWVAGLSTSANQETLGYDVAARKI